jgi:hypothetical protein
MITRLFSLYFLVSLLPKDLYDNLLEKLLQTKKYPPHWPENFHKSKVAR